MSHLLFPKRLEFVTLDVFTKEQFKGNPLAIVKVPRNFDLNQDKKQLIAREFNFSETVFLHEPEEGKPTWKIDIFTTTAELPFAGHPTIGTLCYIGSKLESPTQELMLSTKAGPIAAQYNSMAKVAEAEIPHNVNIHQSTVSWQQIVESQSSLVYDSLDDPGAAFPVVSIVRGMTFILVRVPNHRSLKELGQSHVAISPDKIGLDSEWTPSFVAPYFYDEGRYRDDRVTRIEARMIDPEMGEDPATGSAACALSTCLALQEGVAGQSYSYVIEQGAYIGRDSQIGVKVTLDESGKRVKQVVLSGGAVVVTQGTIAVGNLMPKST